MATTLSWNDVLAEIRAQIDAAAAGKLIASPQSVVTKNWFWTAPSNTVSAYALVAYWFAVAARVGYPALLQEARRYYAEATSRSVPSIATADIQRVLARAVTALDAAGGLKDRRLAGVYRGLGEWSKAASIASAQQRAYEQSGIGIAAGGIIGTGADLIKIGEKAGRVITDKKPPGTPQWLWFLQRNAWFLVGGTVAVGALYLFLKPVLAPLTGVRDAAAAASRRAAGKAVERIERVARNPRRRRRSR
jgi:enamine deaminase RidA (YjgF/YER057c/UK114 family)